MGGVEVRLGEWSRVLADVQDESVRLILTSPPYDNARTYEDTADIVDFSALADFAIRVLEPGGTLAMVLDGAVNDGALSTTPYRVICEWAARTEWRLSQVLAYGRHGQPGQYLHRFRRDHEPLIVFRKLGSPIVCNKDAIALPARHVSRGSLNNHHQAATMRSGGKRRNAVRVVRAIRHRGSIWDYGAIGHGHDPSSSTGHPATFSERFARDAVRVWSNRGDMVVDPFAGSGTVARACVDLGRRSVGAERVAGYHALALARIAAPSQLELEHLEVLG